jgi:hypothetical protein
MYLEIEGVNIFLSLARHPACIAGSSAGKALVLGRTQMHFKEGERRKHTLIIIGPG